MKKPDKLLLNEYIHKLEYASQLRCFPNDKNLSLFESSSLNQIGKLLEYIYRIVREIRDSKKPRKEIDMIRRCRIELEELRMK